MSIPKQLCQMKTKRKNNYCDSRTARGSSAHFVQLGWMQHAEPEQIEFGATEHLPLEELETINVALDQTIAPGQDQSGSNRMVVALKASRKSSQLSNCAVAGPLEPGIQSVHDP